MCPSILDTIMRLVTPIVMSQLKGANGQKLRLAMLWKACEMGDLDALETIIDFLHSTPAEVRAVFVLNMPLALMKWLAAKYEIPKDDAVRAFVSACGERGSADTARWLAQQFQLDDLAEQGPEALIGALYRGELELVKWLIETYKITWDSIISKDDVLQIERNPKVLQYLLSTYDIERAEGFSAFDWACFRGDLNNARVLADFYQFTATEVQSNDNKILKISKNRLLREWLLDTYYKDTLTN